MVIKVSGGNVFDFTADTLLVQSNIHKPCEKPSSLMSQAFALAGEAFKNQFDFETRKGPISYGDVLILNPEGLSDRFRNICVGFPGTGHQDSFIRMLKNLFLFAILLADRLKRPISLSMPPVGTNVGGLSFEEFMESFNDRILALKEGSDFRKIDKINYNKKNRTEVSDRKIITIPDYK